MKSFVKKHEYNYIKKCLRDLNSTFKNCVDINTIDAYKAYTQDKILNLFTDLSEEEKELLDISKISDSLHIDKYLADLNEYVYQMPNITNAQISKLFKKEKKFKLPNLSELDPKNVYLSWVDPSTKKLFIAYNMDGELIGMTCKIPNDSSHSTHICSLCNHVGSHNEVAFVSSTCKTSKGGYRSIGFDICLDSKECNDRIIDIKKLEKLLKEVNNIK